MVIVQLVGGLGNQMFQYAAARRIANINNTSLKFDISHFKYYQDRQYDLDCFNVTQDFATTEEIMRLRGPKTRSFNGLVFKSLEKYKPYYRRRYIRERHYHFDPEIFKISSDVYLEGYWQSEKYFKDIEDIIRNEFKIKHKPDSENRKMGPEISGLQSVSIHIRRGDYVSDPVINKFHGVCPLEYYYTAIKRIAKTIKNPHFYIFSDDIKWAQDSLKIPYPTTFITNNATGKPFEDLRLMSFCKHHIIANSSFSWWGAWLSVNAGKIVFAPKKWFIDAGNNINDLIPGSWHRL